MEVDLVSDEGPKAEIAFKTSVARGISFKGRPLTFETIVIGFFIPADIAQVMMFDVEVEVAEGRGITPESIRDDEGFPERRGRSEGNVEEASGVFGRASRREEPGL
jgi:hypothetical protein